MSKPPDTQKTSIAGFKEVPRERKADFVRQVFDSVAPNYDIMNDVMSAGIHRLWKNAVINWLAPKPGSTILDLAGGTGDIAFRCLQRTADLSMTVIDKSESMLSEGTKRAKRLGLNDKITWIVGDAEALPVDDRIFDACTIGFGLRNFPDQSAALSEIFRVLKTGGRLMILEFSHVEPVALRTLYDRYSFSVIPCLGAKIASDAESYRYLVDSIRRFPDRQTLAQMMRSAGFTNVMFRSYHFGIVAIHSGWKI